MLAYTPNNVESFTNKWNTFVVNLNGIKPGFRNGIKNGITATVTPRDHTNTISTPMSPPYIVAPSFEMRWPIKNGHFNGQNGHNSPAFRLTSHKQLEHSDEIETIEGSDESPPYLPTRPCSISTYPYSAILTEKNNFIEKHV